MGGGGEREFQSSEMIVCKGKTKCSSRLNGRLLLICFKEKYKIHHTKIAFLKMSDTLFHIVIRDRKTYNIKTLLRNLYAYIKVEDFQIPLRCLTDLVVTALGGN